jgi:hypothetical protein
MIVELQCNARIPCFAHALVTEEHKLVFLQTLRGGRKANQSENKSKQDNNQDEKNVRERSVHRKRIMV